MSRQYLSIFMILIIVSSASCKRDDFIWGTRIGNLTYSRDVVLLDREELGLLTEVTEDKMVFGTVTEYLNALTTQNIIVAGITENTPNGLIRRITEIIKDGNSIIFNTTDAFLTDIIKEGTISLRLKMLEKDFTLLTKEEGVLVKGGDKAFDGLAVTLENFRLFSDGTRSATLNGAIGISPEFDITITMRASKVIDIRALAVLNKVDEVTVSSNGAFSGGQRLVAAEFVHSPVIVDSLVFIPEVRIICGFSGIVSGSVNTGVRQDRSVTSELRYVNSSWSASVPVSSEVHDFSIPQVTEDSDLTIFSGPEIILNLFGRPFQIIETTGYYLLEAHKSGSPGWKLLIGGQGNNTMFSDLLGTGADYSSQIVLQEEEIANSGAGK